MYIYVYVCTYICVHMHIHVYTYTYIEPRMYYVVGEITILWAPSGICFSGSLHARRNCGHFGPQKRFDRHRGFAAARQITQGAYGQACHVRVCCHVTWPLHKIAITNLLWCTAYTRGVGGGGVYCAVVVQKYCNTVGVAGGGGNKRMMDFHAKAVKWNNIL